MAAHAVQEQRIQLAGQRAQGADTGQILLKARQRAHPVQPAMGRAAIDLFEPSPEPGVQILQTEDQPLIELAQELVAAGAV